MIIVSQNSFKSSLYIDYLTLSATYQTASINSTIEKHHEKTRHIKYPAQCNMYVGSDYFSLSILFYFIF